MPARLVGLLAAHVVFLGNEVWDTHYGQLRGLPEKAIDLRAPVRSQLPLLAVWAVLAWTIGIVRLRRPERES